MKKSNILTLLTIFLFIPLTLYMGTQMTGRAYYFTGTLVIIEILIPFVLSFESRKPKSREIVIIAALCAFATASRVVVPIPHFKPIFAVIMLSGVALGPQSGFLIGAISAFASNFFVAQGPWTPWQMLAYGVAGVLAGFAVHTCKLPKKPLVLAVFGFVAVVGVVGIVLDLCTVFTSLTTFRWSAVLFILGQGFPNNVMNGVCTALTLLLFSKPFLAMMDRIKGKYGLWE